VVTLRFVLTGLGNIGRTFLEVLLARTQVLRARHGLELRAVGVADASGAALDPDGLDVAAVVALKQQRRGVASLPGARAGMTAAELLAACEADLLLEATPNHDDGEPGLSLVRAALRRRMSAVLASKGPLAVAFAELAALSDLSPETGPDAPALRFSAAVGGALPSVNLGRRDLAGERIDRVEAVLNATTQTVLGLRAQGLSARAALAEAQRVGIAEPDPALDLSGRDAACKLVILANAALGRPTRLADVAVVGIDGVTDEELRAAAAAGGRVSLLAVAQALPGAWPVDYRMSVAPTTLGPDHPLARLGPGEMGVVYHGDLCGRTTATNLAEGPVGSVSAMLRDVIEVARRR
jgi:homoserine dehydrogenase